MQSQKRWKQTNLGQYCWFRYSELSSCLFIAVDLDKQQNGKQNTAGSKLVLRNEEELIWKIKTMRSEPPMWHMIFISIFGFHVGCCCAAALVFFSVLELQLLLLLLLLLPLLLWWCRCCLWFESGGFVKIIPKIQVAQLCIGGGTTLFWFPNPLEINLSISRDLATRKIEIIIQTPKPAFWEIGDPIPDRLVQDFEKWCCQYKEAEVAVHY